MMGQGDRTERLLEAGLALSSELSLSAMLQRIVDLAADLTGARYGALGVVGRDGTITEFITTGVTGEQRAAIGHIPVGRGILGVLIDDATPCGCATSPRIPARSGSRRITRPCGRSLGLRCRPEARCSATCT